MVKDIGRTRGLINGQVKDGKTEFRIDDLWRYQRRKALLGYLSIFIIACILLSVIFISSQNVKYIVFRVDNRYDEWSELMDIGLGKFGIAEGNHGLYITIQRDGVLTGYGNRTEAYMIFLNDKREEYGYNIGYDTFEYYIDIYGYNNTVSGASGFRFDRTKNNSDWNGFMSAYAPFRVDVANTDDQMELSMYPIQFGQANVSVFDNYSLLIYHFDPYGDYEYSQVLDIDDIKYNNTVNDETRSDRISYYHIFEKNELHIITRESLAYSNIPYEVRIIQDDQPPVPEQTWAVLETIIEGKPLPPKGSYIGCGNKTVCDDCPRVKEEKKIYPSEDYSRIKDKKFSSIYMNNGREGIYIKYDETSPYPDNILYLGYLQYNYSSINIRSATYVAPADSLHITRYFALGDESNAEENTERYLSAKIYPYKGGSIPVIVTSYLENLNHSREEDLNLTRDAYERLRDANLSEIFFEGVSMRYEEINKTLMDELGLKAPPEGGDDAPAA